MTDTKVGYRGGYEQKEREGEIGFLNDEIRIHKRELGDDNTAFWVEMRIANLTEIKQILSEMSCRKSDKDDDLVKKTILDMFYECDFDTDGNANFIYDEEALKDFIRKLLEGRT